MDYLAVLGTLGGVLVGGLVNFLATRASKDREWRLALDKELLIMRNKAYTEFLDEYDSQLARLPAAGFPTDDDRHKLRSRVNAMTFCAGTQPVILADRLRRRLYEVENSKGPGLWELRDEFLIAATSDLQLLNKPLLSRPHRAA